MFEGIINLQLPFMLISSGVSSVLYLIFLFFNLGHPSPEEMAQDNHQITIEESSETKADSSEDFQYEDYFTQKNTLNKQSLYVDAGFSLRLTQFRHYKFRHTYSMHFAGASFSRPPPPTTLA